MTTDDPIIRTQADLEQVWRTLMEPLGFSDGSLWLLAIGPDDRPTQLLVEIEDEGAAPSPEQAANLGETLAILGEDVEPGTRWAILRVAAGPQLGDVRRPEPARLDRSRPAASGRSRPR